MVSLMVLVAPVCPVYTVWGGLCFPGDDADLCSELLQESLGALRALPEATLFDEGTVSSVWLEVVERATKFLGFVLKGFFLSFARFFDVVRLVWDSPVPL